MSFGERFLRDAGLFPARRAGEAWGDRRVVVDFAGGPYAFTGLSQDQEERTRERLEGFCSADPTPAVGVECRVFRVSADEFVRFDLRGWEMTFDLDHASEGVRVVGCGLMARLEWRPALSAALWTDAAGPEFPGILENLFRVLVAYRLLETGGLLLHSSAIVDAGQAWLFLGRSGAGKSTLARLSLSEGREVISDDLNALIREDGATVVEGVPFAGDYRLRRRGRRPLAVVGTLRQGPTSKLEALPHSAAVAAAISCAPYVNRDPYRVERLMDNAAGLLSSYPTKRLTFGRETHVWPVSEEAAIA